MKAKTKKAVITVCGVVVIIALGAIVGTRIDNYAAAAFNMTVKWVWSLLFTLAVAAFFARANIKAWFGKGKLTVSPLNFIPLALYLIALIPQLGIMNYLMRNNYFTVYLILVFYSTITAFSKTEN